MSGYPRISHGRPEWCSECGEFQVLYGFGGGVSPLDFEPDLECCTAAELWRWAVDGGRAAKGLPPLDPPEGCWHATYGVGAYWAPCGCAERAAA